MKDKIVGKIKIVFVIAVGVGVCIGIFNFLDVALNGMVVDWVEKNAMEEIYEYSADAGGYVGIIRPYWSLIKQIILAFFVFNVVFWLIVIFVVSYFQEKKERQRTITAVSQMIRRYMDGDKEVIEIFPKEYAEISAQMLEIRAGIQRHEQMLKDETNRKNDLIAYLAHDLKTPLTSVIGYLSLLKEIPDMPMKQRVKYVDITLDKAQRLEQLINEFFDITRYNLQQIDLEKEQIDLYYMLVQMTDEFYPLLNANANRIELMVEEQLTVYGDPVKLARVFNNILKNAIAYSYQNTVIKVRAVSTEKELHLFFSNQGRTIPKQKLESIFDKFFRLDEARMTNTGGAGLGLAIAKEIVNLHGGTIKVESEAERTTFCVTLPQPGKGSRHN